MPKNEWFSCINCGNQFEAKVIKPDEARELGLRRHNTSVVRCTNPQCRSTDLLRGAAMTTGGPKPISIFCSYSHSDMHYMKELKSSFSVQERQGKFTAWHDREIAAGDDLDHTILKKLEQASIVLMLVSRDFLNSRYCYEVEFKSAMKRCEDGLVKVIPIILRDCDWRHTKLGELKALPDDGKPINHWDREDDAFQNVVEGVRRVIETVDRSEPDNVQTSIPATQNPTISLQRARFQIPRVFTDYEKDEFKQNSMTEIKRVFVDSLESLCGKDRHLKYRLETHHAGEFTVKIYKQEKLARCCRIWSGEGHLKIGDICFSTDLGAPNSANAWFTVENRDGDLCLKGSPFHGAEMCTPEEAAIVLLKILLEN